MSDSLLAFLFQLDLGNSAKVSTNVRKTLFIMTELQLIVEPDFCGTNVTYLLLVIKLGYQLCLSV